jgi:glyoxylase-like metal-dependent hydrolase (beta-lactamase superfamily II)
MLHVATFRFNHFYENTYLAFDNAGVCMLIDPGMYTKEERDQIDRHISFLGLQIRYIILTHAHIDHILGLAYAQQRYEAPLVVHRAEYRNLPLLKNYGATQGYVLDDIKDNVLFVQEGDAIQLGSLSFAVYHTPGHTPNSISLYNEPEAKLFSGDVLFYNAIGNTHLPGGDRRQLIETIETKILSLPPDTEFYPGHGSSTTIGYIRSAIEKGYFSHLKIPQAL